MSYLSLWKDKWAIHCPKCDNVWNLAWLDGDDKIGEAQLRCPECLTVFVPTGKMCKTKKTEHGKLSGNSKYFEESLNAKAKRLARE